MPDPAMPYQVRVGQVCYSITDDADAWMRIEHARQSKGAYGFTENLTATIYLNPAMGEAQRRITLWHEVLHAVFESALGSPSLKHLGPEREETIIRMLEAPTLNVLADNPELVAYLTA